MASATFLTKTSHESQSILSFLNLDPEDEEEESTLAEDSAEESLEEEPSIFSASVAPFEDAVQTTLYDSLLFPPFLTLDQQSNDERDSLLGSEADLDEFPDDMMILEDRILSRELEDSRLEHAQKKIQYALSTVSNFLSSPSLAATMAGPLSASEVPQLLDDNDSNGCNDSNEVDEQEIMMSLMKPDLQSSNTLGMESGMIEKKNHPICTDVHSVPIIPSGTPDIMESDYSNILRVEDSERSLEARMHSVLSNSEEFVQDLESPAEGLSLNEPPHLPISNMSSFPMDLSPSLVSISPCELVVNRPTLANQSTISASDPDLFHDEGLSPSSSQHSSSLPSPMKRSLAPLSRKPSSLEASLSYQIMHELPADKLSGVLKIIHAHTSSSSLSPSLVHSAGHVVGQAFDLTGLSQSKLLGLYEYVSQCIQEKRTGSRASSTEPSPKAGCASPSSPAANLHNSSGSPVSPSTTLTSPSRRGRASASSLSTSTSGPASSASHRRSSAGKSQKSSSTGRRRGRRSSATSDLETICTAVSVTKQSNSSMLIFDENSDEEIDVVGF